MTAGASSRRQWAAFVIVVAAVAVMPWLGKGPLLAAIMLAALLIGMPLFALISAVAIACFLLFMPDKDSIDDLRNMIERINELADSENLLAVPLFMLSGSIMARGEISSRLIDFSKAMIGSLPGGLGVSGVAACMLFAAISGSSPATVVAIGAMMAPTLISNGYSEKFSHGLLTSSGSLGILIPPSIPMILYPLVYAQGGVETSRLFASGFGPGLIIGGILAGFCVVQGIRDKAIRQPFVLSTLRHTSVDGFWSLLFPFVILGGIYTGFFTVVEAAGISVVYAVVVEVTIHRALKLGELPAIVKETGVILGSLLVIMVAALAFSEFLHLAKIPEAAVGWIESMELSPVVFLIILNILLLVVGAFMDIMSAMFLFVPLLAPVAVSMGVDPMHFGIIFIVNLEIGYLTPPVGLNLFVGSTLFNKPLGHMVRSVAPFIGAMLIGLGIITYVPAVSVGFGNWIIGDDGTGGGSTPSPLDDLDGPLDDAPLDDPPGDHGAPGDGVQTMEEMMQESGAGAAGPRTDGRALTMEEMMRLANEPADDPAGENAAEDAEPAEQDPDAPTAQERRAPDRVMTMEEMMEAAGD